MQYVLTEEELCQIKEDARRKGYKDAEDLLSLILKGSTSRLMITDSDGKPESIWNERHKDNPWRKLLDLRDSKTIPPVPYTKEQV